MNTQRLPRTRSLLAAGVAIAAVAALAACAPAGDTASATLSPAETVATAPIATESAANAPATTTPTAEPTADLSDTASSLRYLIEEEKLAHDVYVALFDAWGLQAFDNISASEVRHQDELVPLLEARGIADPRSTELGVFTDPALQATYDELLARGLTSEAEAIQVGIAIEEMDIDDLEARIAAEDEPDVIAAYEFLLQGSRNHLDAFQRLAS